MDADHFAERVQSLPPELYNMICDEVFTVDPRERQITESYEPPKPLSIDSVSRELYAKTYYGSPIATFIHRVVVGMEDTGLDYDDGYDTLADSEATLVLRLKALPTEHRSLIPKIKIIIEVPKTKSGGVHYGLKPLLAAKILSEIKKDWLDTLEMERVMIKNHVPRFQSRVVYVDV